MQFTKTTVSAILGLLVLLFFIAITYYTNPIFLDKIVLCSFILGMVFFVKLLGEGNSYNNNANDVK